MNIWTERVRKLIIIPSILNEFSCGKVQIPCPYCSKVLGKRRFHAHCIFPHKLEQCMKVFARGCVENTGHNIKSCKYSNAANKDKVFPLYCMKIHSELRKW